MWRSLLAALVVFALGQALPARADPDPRNWPAVLEEARGETVYWNAWAGEPRINAYIAWAGREVEARQGVRVVHVKLADTAEAVARVVAEKAAGTTAGGAVDLIWVNGENFAALKRGGLLFGPWAEDLPNFPFTDPANNPAVRVDFTVPVEGYEAPLGKAQLVFYYDGAALAEPPRTLEALAAWAEADPGRFSYPLPPDFLGSTFLKQALLSLAADRAVLSRPAADADFAAVSAPLWRYLDALHPHLWRGGRAFPANSAELRRLIADGEIEIAFSFNPQEAAAAVANGELPATVKSFVLDGGTLGNLHFLAIPFNAANKAGAMVLANFLLSPEAQAHKQDPEVWGDDTVLSVGLLQPADKARFDVLPRGAATLPPEARGAVLPEPHPSWMERLEAEWKRRYTLD
jgi:putative thiamine transport system substrate-binding protein